MLYILKMLVAFDWIFTRTVSEAYLFNTNFAYRFIRTMSQNFIYRRSKIIINVTLLLIRVIKLICI